MEEVNNLLKRLGELEDAPLIWVNKKVYDMAQEIKRLKEENERLEAENYKLNDYINTSSVCEKLKSSNLEKSIRDADDKEC